MATRLFLRSATSGLTGLPTTEQNPSVNASKNFQAQSTSQTLSITKGASQTSIGGTLTGSTATQRYWFSRFVSDPLNMTSISANTWTMNMAATSSSGNANFPASASGGMYLNLFVWRPSTQTKVGEIYEDFTSSVNEATTTERVKQGTFSGKLVGGMQNGDVLVFELWETLTASSTATNIDIRYYFNGTTENTTAEASVTNHASFIQTPQNLTFAGGGAGTSLVSATSRHKYNVLQNTAILVSAKSTHKYHVSPRDGFTIMSRILIPFANNEDFFGRRSTLFSKIDSDQVDSAYMAQMDDVGNVYWFVRSLGRERWIKATGIVDPELFDVYDFTSSDFNSIDYYTQEHLPPLPHPLQYVDVAFTYAFADGRMQILKNGTVVYDTDLPPVSSGLVARWLLDEGSGTTAFNRVNGKPKGTIVGATWNMIGGKNYLKFVDPSNNYVSIPSYSDIQLENTGEMTISVWYYPTDIPPVGGFDQLWARNWALNGSWIIYIDNSGGARCVVAAKNSAGVSYSIIISNVFGPGLNRWYHIVFRLKYNSPLSVNIDNVKTVGSTPVIGPVTTGTPLTLIGGSSIPPNGYIRDVCYWNRELTDAEVTTIFNAGETYPLTNGLVGHWMCNEGGDIGNQPVLPTDFSSIVRNSVRITGATNGSLINTDWVTVDDKPHETYLSIDAAASYVDIPNYSAVETVTGLTVSFWYYPRSQPTALAGHQIVQKNQDGLSNRWLVNMPAATTDLLRFYIYESGGTVRTLDKTSAFPDGLNKWYHIVAKWSSGNTMKLFVNNVKVTGTTVTNTLATGSTPIRFGHSGNTSADGLVHDVKLWNRELSDLEVATIWNQGHAEAGFPAWKKEPDPPPETPVPITNPFVEVYDVPLPSSGNQELVRLHAVVATGFEEKYDVAEGSPIGAQSPPFVTVLDQPPTGGGGGGGTPETVYNVSHDGGGSHLEYDEYSRRGVRVDSDSNCIGKVVTSVTFRGRKYGEPSGTVYCRIWKAGGGVVEMGNTGVSGWVESEADQFTFTNTGNTYACVNGDIIGFEISWAPDASDSIENGQSASIAGYTGVQWDGAWTNAGVETAMKIDVGTATGGTDVALVWPAFNETCFGCPAGANGLLRYGIRVPSGSTLIGKKPTKVTFHLKKVGSPTGLLGCYIHRDGGTVAVQFGASLDVATLTGTLTAKEFINLSNGLDSGYALKANDRIYIVWQSVNNANYVVTQRLAGTTVGDAIETAYGDSDPAANSTTIGWFQNNSNDACIKVETGGYTTSAKDPWFELNNVNTKIGERVKAAGSAINNMKITRFRALLQAVQNPSGTIFCKVYDSSNTARKTIGTVDASTVSTQDFEEYEFTNIYQDFVLQTGWGIFLEYTGGDATNKIMVNVKHEETGVDPEPSTTLVVFSGAYTEITADIAGSMFTGGSATDPAARIRVGEKVALETSALKLKKISRAEVRLKRTGSNTPGQVFMRMRKPEDDSIIATVGQMDASSVPLSTTAITFTKIPVNIVGIPTGGILSVEYDDGDDNNYIEVMVSKVNVFDDTAKTYVVKYDALLGAYEQMTSQELVGILEEGGDTFTPSAGEAPPPEPPAYNHDLMIFAGGYDWEYDSTPMNWLGSVTPDFRIYWKILTLQELMNIFVNRLDRSNIPYAGVARTGYFSMPEQV